MKTELILLGGGGHCKSCIDVIESTGNYLIRGILDCREKVGQTCCGYPILGVDADADYYAANGGSFLVTVGQITHSSVRRRLYENAVTNGFALPPIVASTAHVSVHACLHPGCIVMHQAVVNAGAVVGANTIINTFANIEHDVTIGSCCHISTGAMVNGDCVIGNDVFVGSGAVVSNGVTIADGTVIGAGAVVLHSIEQRGTYVGNPIKKLI